MPLLFSRRSSLLLASTALIGGPACTSRGGRFTYDLSKLPAYESPSTEMFDDIIEPSALGLSMSDADNLTFDTQFQQRIRLADTVSHVRITTVTIRKVDEKSSYSLRFESIQNFKGILEDDLQELSVSEHNPHTFGAVNALGVRARGRTMIGCWRRFREQDRMIIHFHVFPDTENVIKAIQDALAIEDLKK